MSGFKSIGFGSGFEPEQRTLFYSVGAMDGGESFEEVLSGGFVWIDWDSAEGPHGHVRNNARMTPDQFRTRFEGHPSIAAYEQLLAEKAGGSDG